MKKTLKTVGTILLILLLFRGWIYRFTINYEVVGTRQTFSITNPELVYKINSKSGQDSISIKNIIDIANTITIQSLSFSRQQISKDPNRLIVSKRANCIGYAAMFNAIVNYLINKYQLNNSFKAYHRIGKLDFFGIDLHQSLDHSFFRDHDFNQIIDLKTGEVISIDPSVSDYLGIKEVSSN